MILETMEMAIGYKTRRQPPRVVAEHLNLRLEAGELICLLGPNGAGKSTLMRTLAGMHPPLAGQVRLEGEPLTSLSPQAIAKKMSLVLTERVNVGLLSVYALVALGRYPYTDWHGRLTAEDESMVRQSLESVGALALAARPVSELSDGERQKVMIARALAQAPRLMMLDEPTAFLDMPRRVEVMQLLRRLAHDHDCAILLSTHDLDLALRSADTIWLMSGGQVRVGAPEDLVMNGAFATAFAGEGVQFDPYSGSFHLTRGERGAVDILGDGLSVTWAARAAERLGYRVQTGLTGAPIQVVCNKQGWHLTHFGRMTHYTSLGELTTVLRQLPSSVTDEGVNVAGYERSDI
jgi:iron complex transport system ATP-binding protein